MGHSNLVTMQWTVIEVVVRTADPGVLQLRHQRGYGSERFLAVWQLSGQRRSGERSEVLYMAAPLVSDSSAARYLF